MKSRRWNRVIAGRDVENGWCAHRSIAPVSDNRAGQEMGVNGYLVEFVIEMVAKSNQSLTSQNREQNRCQKELPDWKVGIVCPRELVG